MKKESILKIDQGKKQLSIRKNKCILLNNNKKISENWRPWIFRLKWLMNYLARWQSVSKSLWLKKMKKNSAEYIQMIRKSNDSRVSQQNES